jgi:Rps23 Pro-64 3,4-dihydroxylase Tpa1-like proline 4-hydroxylase
VDQTTIIKNLSEIKMQEYPFQHFVSKNFLSLDLVGKIQDDLIELERSQPQNKFESQFGTKKEWKVFPDELVSLNSWLNLLASENFINSLKEKFDISKQITIVPDLTYDGGGYVVSPPGSYLGYHADFNFSSAAGKYRVINILFYMNPNYEIDQGGHLHLLDSHSKTVEKSVLPEQNTILGFFTDDTSFHGVSLNQVNFYRRSFNLYYYSDAPISKYQSVEPHKTIWLDIDSHEH